MGGPVTWCELWLTVLFCLAEPWRECLIDGFCELLYEFEFEFWEVTTPALSVDAAVLLIGRWVTDDGCFCT